MYMTKKSLQVDICQKYKNMINNRVYEYGK